MSWSQKIGEILKKRKISPTLLWCLILPSPTPTLIIFIDGTGAPPNMSTLRGLQGTAIFSRGVQRFLPYKSVVTLYGDKTNVNVILYDLDALHGRRLKNSFSRIDNSLELAELVGHASQFTKDKKAERGRIMGQESRIVKLAFTELSERDDTCTWVFMTPATRDGKKKQEVHPSADFRLVDNPTNVYTLYLRAENVFKTLDIFKEEVVEETFKLSEMSALVDLLQFKIFSTSPSLHYQGMNYNLSVFDASIFPTNIKPKQWDKIHGFSFLDKHWLALLNYYKVYLNQMAVAFNSQVKQSKWFQRNLSEYQARRRGVQTEDEVVEDDTTDGDGADGEEGAEDDT